MRCGPRTPARGPQDHLGRELPPFELLALRQDARAATRLSRRPVYPIRTRRTNLQQILRTGVSDQYRRSCRISPALLPRCFGTPDQQWYDLKGRLSPSRGDGAVLDVVASLTAAFLSELGAGELLIGLLFAAGLM